MKRLYVLHPGLVVSRYDGDSHYVGAGQLARLYGVRFDECRVWSRFARYPEDALHLWPRERRPIPEGRWRLN